MCVMTTLGLVGSGLAYAASAIGTAATAAGSAAMTAGSAIGAGLSTIGSAAWSGLTSLGSMVSSGATAAGSAISSGAATVADSTASMFAPLTKAYAVGAASGATNSGLTVPGMLVGSTEATAFNAGAEVSMLTAMADNSVAMTAGNIADAAAGVGAGSSGTVAGKAAGALGGSLGIGLGDLATVGQAAAGLGQGAFEGYAGMQENRENAKELERQAKLNEIRAGQAQQAAEVEKMDLARKQRQLIGSGRAAAAANGVMLEGRAESSPAMFEQDAEAELAWDNAKIDYNANLESWGYMENAAAQRRQAKSLRSMGKMKLASGLIKGAVGAAGALMNGWSRNATNAALYA